MAQQLLKCLNEGLATRCAVPRVIMPKVARSTNRNIFLTIPTKHVDVIRGSKKSCIVMLFRSSSRKTVAPKMYGLRWFKTRFFRFSTWNSTAFCHLGPPWIRRKIATIGNHRVLVVRQDGSTWYTGGTRRMYWFRLPDLTGVIPVMRVVYQIDMGI